MLCHLEASQVHQEPNSLSVTPQQSVIWEMQRLLWGSAAMTAEKGQWAGDP